MNKQLDTCLSGGSNDKECILAVYSCAVISPTELRSPGVGWFLTPEHDPFVVFPS